MTWSYNRDLRVDNLFLQLCDNLTDKVIPSRDFFYFFKPQKDPTVAIQHFLLFIDFNQDRLADIIHRGRDHGLPTYKQVRVRFNFLIVSYTFRCPLIFQDKFLILFFRNSVVYRPSLLLSNSTQLLKSMSLPNWNKLTR